ncbi:LPP20 family lipoprotein [Seohaeicola saemankumensis]|uniref:LPP20 family lipoprotein n=1 Tax=Seohaeicola saemankumensis TaxID=481181 RepID=UPI001E28B127|nr:LPP20 family lipoprotein [Seohaeicola saemankumensis]MCD1625089.1 LPP20 family lipoprotein [Seohaeicola saemankumensis]
MTPSPDSPFALTAERSFTTKALGVGVAILLLSALSGCSSSEKRAIDALGPDATAATRMLAETKDSLDALDQATVPASAIPTMQAVTSPALTGRGFSQVAGQPGHTLNEKRLLAIRAARLDALRDLTEQIHGIRISSDSLLRDAIMLNDVLAAHVSGVLRGARTVAIEPKGEDGYSVIMELDADTVAYILRAVGAGA